MKEAVLDFAQRREIPPPSWWTDRTSVSTDAGVTTNGTHSIAGSPALTQTHSARLRGRKAKKLNQVKAAMTADIRRGQKTPDGLRDMLEKELAAGYGVSRDTARKARDAVLSEMPRGAQGRRQGRTGRARAGHLVGNSIRDISNKNDR